MAIDGDLDTMVAIAHTYIDEFYGGHNDTDLVKMYDSTNPTLKRLMLIPGEQKLTKMLLALISDLLHRVYHLEHP